mgnify:CR=1 FL=1
MHFKADVGSDVRSKVLGRGMEPETLLTPAEVATIFRVDPKTVTRWAKAGKLTAIRTLGGHRRFRQSEVQALLSSNTFTEGEKS